jgi:hypothetical protein
MGGQDHFCVVNCSNRRSNLPKGYAFHQISARPFARWNAWIRAIGRNFRKKKGELTVTENTKVCGAHFVNKRKSNDPTDIDYVPTINSIIRTFSVIRRHRTVQNCDGNSCDNSVDMYKWIFSFSESNRSLNPILNCRLRISMISLITVSRIFDWVWQYNMKCYNVSSLLPHTRHILLFSPFMVTLVTIVLICINDARFNGVMVQLHVIRYGFYGNGTTVYIKVQL